jgi:hypothetical protein
VERANADVTTMVTQWMEDEKSTRWSYGIHFIAHKRITDSMKVSSRFLMYYDMGNHAEWG